MQWNFSMKRLEQHKSSDKDTLSHRGAVLLIGTRWAYHERVSAAHHVPMSAPVVGSGG